jgi:hypothetical protein
METPVTEMKNSQIYFNNRYELKKKINKFWGNQQRKSSLRKKVEKRTKLTEPQRIMKYYK